MNIASTQILMGVGLDLLLGDPCTLPHPIRALGWTIECLERSWRRTGLPLRLAGAGLWISSVGCAVLAVRLTTPLANLYWIWALLALRELDLQAGAVVRELQAGNLALARRRLSTIVGRDTETLDEPEILRAVIETMAENLSDGVIAPLFYLALAGPAGMAAYKAVNTLDSMVGYRSARYREFGWASARLDDAANFLPARLTALLIFLCAALLRYDAVRAVRVTWRDASLQPSPNAGYPEAAMAGALGIRLGGVNRYHGVPSPKAYLGDPVRPVTRASFSQARRLLYGSAALMAVLVCLFVRRRKP
ncbi:MAG: adenosylcobinamide-phosphate synthase CbiB [Bryobacteraceae bacterium]